MSSMKDTIKIAPGAYTLSRDVENPAPDRRSPRDWHKHERWAAGTEFLVSGQPEIDLADLTDNEDLRGKQIVRNPNQIIQSVAHKHYDFLKPSDSAQWDALVAAFVPVEHMSWEAFWLTIDRHSFVGMAGSDLVRWLVARKYITRERLEAEMKMWADASGWQGAE